MPIYSASSSSSFCKKLIDRSEGEFVSLKEIVNELYRLFLTRENLFKPMVNSAPWLSRLSIAEVTGRDYDGTFTYTKSGLEWRHSHYIEIDEFKGSTRRHNRIFCVKALMDGDHLWNEKEWLLHGKPIEDTNKIPKFYLNLLKTSNEDGFQPAVYFCWLHWNTFLDALESFTVPVQESKNLTKDELNALVIQMESFQERFRSVLKQADKEFDNIQKIIVEKRIENIKAATASLFTTAEEHQMFDGIIKQELNKRTLFATKRLCDDDD